MMMKVWSLIEVGLVHISISSSVKQKLRLKRSAEEMLSQRDTQLEERSAGQNYVQEKYSLTSTKLKRLSSKVTN